MSTFVLGQIEASIFLFQSLIQHSANTPRYRSHLQWLSKLHTRASTKVSAASTPEDGGLGTTTLIECQRSEEDEHEAEGMDLLGWRTRLIERAQRNRRNSRAVNFGTASTAAQYYDAPDIQSSNTIGTAPNFLSLEAPVESIDDLVRFVSEAKAVSANV